MSGGLFVGVEKYLIGGINDATKGLMMSYSSMMMGAGSSVSYHLHHVAWIPDLIASLYADGRHDVGHQEDKDHPSL